MAGLATTYCVALIGATIGVVAALMLIRTLSHLDDAHG